MLLKDVLQDAVVAVGVGTEVRTLTAAPLQTGLCHSVTLGGAGQPMQGGVGLMVVEPLTLVDVGIGGVGSGYEAEGSYQ